MECGGFEDETYFIFVQVYEFEVVRLEHRFGLGFLF